MLTLACSTPQPRPFRLPKRIARARRVAESKRMDTFREIHEALKKTAAAEKKFLSDIFIQKDSEIVEEDED